MFETSGWQRWLLAGAIAVGFNCSGETELQDPIEVPDAGDDTSDAGPRAGTGGSAGAAGGGAGASAGAGAGGASGSAAVGGSGGRSGRGGGGAGASGRGGRGGSMAAGSGGGTSTGGSGGAMSSGPMTPLDCGPNGVAIENAGPPKNRVNYVIVGDGYTQEQLGTTFMQHLDVAMQKRFSEVIGQPYGRYRKFVNICALKIASPSGPIGSGTTAFDCTGDDQSRLARCNTSKVNMAISANLPSSFEVDWKAVVLNNTRWWNTGSTLMLWSGGNKDAAGAALHEGGHGFHQLADEYNGNEQNCSREYGEVNVTADSMMTAGKWDKWLGYDQVGATGVQGTIAGARYCMSGQYRPSMNSMMNQLFGDRPNTSYNPVSREKMIMDIWRAVTPIDSTNPPAGSLAAPAMLQVEVIDPAVINVDWSIDGEVVAANGGTSFDLAARNLPSGSHTVSAKAYDNAGMDLVRYTSGTQYGRMNWSRSQQTVTWTVNVP